ncbi:hypothetical protein B0H16DRAFT_1724381 [Mycena metata]|uniref:Uncharacterized protein n=1 Tax=Mycena metata TaxID=1033252 RepID=A0AAD7IUR0_9AGAR|nr:hypothetical protein B0H16DRAFT_1724381 [Mycena metata]
MLATNLQPYTAVSKPRTLKPSPHATFPYDLTWALSYLAWKNVQLDKAPLCLVFEENFAEGADAGVFGDGTTPGHFLRKVDLSGFGNGEFEMTTSSSNNSFLQNGYLYIVPTLTNGGVGNDYNATDCTFNLTAPNGGFTAGPNGDEFDYAGYFAACSRTTNSTAGTIIDPVQSARLSTILSAKGASFGPCLLRIPSYCLRIWVLEELSSYSFGLSSHSGFGGFWAGRRREDGDDGEDDAVPADYGAGGGERVVHGVEVDAIRLVRLCGRVMAERGELKELRALQRLGRCCTLRISRCGSGSSALSTMRVFALLRSTGSSGSRVCVLEWGDLVSSSSLVSAMALSCRIVRATGKGDRRVSMLARPGILLVGGRSRKRLKDGGDGVARGMIVMHSQQEATWKVHVRSMVVWAHERRGDVGEEAAESSYADGRPQCAVVQPAYLGFTEGSGATGRRGCSRCAGVRAALARSRVVDTAVASSAGIRPA